MRTLHYTITQQQAGRRVDDFLIREQGFSRRVITTLKRLPEGLLRNGVHIRTIDPLQAGDTLEINLPEPDKRIPLCDRQVPILYIDDDLLVYNKPADMPVHQSGGHIFGTLDGVYAALCAQTGKPASMRAINRLDKDTSGAVVIARHQIAAGILWKAVEKRYVAVVMGIPPASGTIDLPIMREQPMEMKRIVHPEGQRSVTHYRVLAAGEAHSLVEFQLETGRTHQIRVHMAHMGYPLVGDIVYGSPDRRIDRQALHCREVLLNHPITRQPLSIQAPLPTDMTALLEQLQLFL